MTARAVNPVSVIVGGRRTIPITERLTIALTPARACRVADFELRHAVKIEQVILDFLDDQIFSTSAD